MLDDEKSNDFVLPLTMSKLPYDAVYQSEVLTMTDDCLISSFFLSSLEKQMSFMPKALYVLPSCFAWSPDIVSILHSFVT